jgi:hypothetical protein
MVLAFTGNHGDLVYAIVITVVIVIAPWLRQRWVPAPPPPGATATS